MDKQTLFERTAKALEDHNLDESDKVSVSIWEKLSKLYLALDKQLNKDNAQVHMPRLRVKV